MEANGENIGGSDPRLDYMGAYVQKRLKLKPEKWLRLTSIDEHKTTLKEFLDGSTQMHMIIALTQSAQLVPLVNFPLSQLKTKGEQF